MTLLALDRLGGIVGATRAKGFCHGVRYVAILLCVSGLIKLSLSRLKWEINADNWRSKGGRRLQVRQRDGVVYSMTGQYGRCHGGICWLCRVLSPLAAGEGLVDC